MTAPLTLTREAARRVWTRAAHNETGAPALARVAVTLHEDLRTALVRWIGVDGYSALFLRAHTLARPEHPILEAIAPGAREVSINALAARIDSDAAIAASMEVLLTQMLDLLGRIIGVEMAVRLIEDAGAKPRLIDARPNSQEIP
jgi:hypothetical protein